MSENYINPIFETTTPYAFYRFKEDRIIQYEDESGIEHYPHFIAWRQDEKIVAGSRLKYLEYLKKKGSKDISWEKLLHQQLQLNYEKGRFQLGGCYVYVGAGGKPYDKSTFGTKYPFLYINEKNTFPENLNYPSKEPINDFVLLFVETRPSKFEIVKEKLEDAIPGFKDILIAANLEFM